MQTMFIRIALVAGVAGLGAGCATTQAKAPVERPALEMPSAPPRVIEPAPSPEVMPDPVPELPPPPANPKPRPPQREASRPDPKLETPPADPAPVAQPPVQPVVPPLRTASSTDSAEATRQITEMRNRAKQLLDVTDYQRLTAEQRLQYDNAKRFIDEADEALKAKNFEFARGVAEKAEKLARELQGR
jgi:hypothetical protein